MQFHVSLPNLAKELEKAEKETARFITAGMQDAVDGLKEEYRTQVRAAGLGERLAKTWQGKRYPEKGASLNPAAYVWSKAPEIIDSFSRGAHILPLGGKRFLWIPTDNVPRDRNAPRGSTRKASPAEVELQFNQDLFFRRGRNGRVLAFINAVRSKNRKGWRQGTQRRLAQGRDLQPVLMFTLVPTVRLPRRLDIPGPAQRWAARVPALIAARWR